jgi:hypothetical protein
LGRTIPDVAPSVCSAALRISVAKRGEEMAVTIADAILAE